MDAIALQREKIRQLQNVLPRAEPHEWPEIRGLIMKNKILLALLIHLSVSRVAGE
jgi:hypothetical protein